MTLLES